MIEVPISECEVLSGRTGPILFHDKLIKIESLPEWSCSTIKCIRDQRDEDKSYHFNPQKEILANYTARKLEIFTPEIVLEDIMLIDGRDSFKTKASIRAWLPGPRYQTYPKLWDFCKRIPNVCSRIDFMYILLSDFLIGFWDRYTRNLVYDRDKDVIIPIDYDDAFRFDIMPMDINGAIEFTEKSTNPGDPVFVYNPVRDDIIEGCHGEGVAIMAVDTLPCELPQESSQAFSDSLLHFIPDIVKTDYSMDFNHLSLPPEIKKAVILHHGRLTPDYEYINKFL